MTEADGGNGGGPHDDSYGGIEIDSETWHSESQERHLPHWSQRSRNDSMGKSESAVWGAVLLGLVHSFLKGDCMIFILGFKLLE